MRPFFLISTFVFLSLPLMLNAAALAPPPPKNCPTIMGPSGPTPDHICENKYAEQLLQYQTAQDKILADQLAAKQAASATDKLNQIEQQNKTGQAQQQVMQSMFSALSSLYQAKYAASCSSTCQNALLAASILNSILSSKSGAQAGNHSAMANSACTSYNKIATAGKACGSIATGFDPNNPAFPNQQINPNTGKCLASAPPSCTANRNALLADSSFDPKSLQPGAAGFPGAGKDFKFNPDGSITTKDGKKYKASDFDSEKSMIAAGFSAQDAAAAFAASKNNAATKLANSVADDLKAPEFGSFGAGGAGGTMTIKTDVPSESSALGTKDLGNKRDLASEGLVRNFNGDVIGISNDDIFKMMNKRYNLKTEQDTFIGQ